MKKINKKRSPIPMTLNKNNQINIIYFQLHFLESHFL